MEQPVGKTVWQLKELKTALSRDPVIPLLNKKQKKNAERKEIPQVHSSIIHNSQKVHSTQQMWMHKHTMEYYSALKSKETLTQAK